MVEIIRGMDNKQKRLAVDAKKFIKRVVVSGVLASPEFNHRFNKSDYAKFLKHVAQIPTVLDGLYPYVNDPVFRILINDILSLAKKAPFQVMDSFLYLAENRNGVVRDELISFVEEFGGKDHANFYFSLSEQNRMERGKIAAHMKFTALMKSRPFLPECLLPDLFAIKNQISREGVNQEVRKEIDNFLLSLREEPA